MIQIIESGDFINAFRAYNRFDQFGREALNILFDYLEECDPKMEIDVIAICCDYSHDTAEEIAESYDIDLSDCEDEDEKADTVREWLTENTTLVGETSTGFVYFSSF